MSEGSETKPGRRVPTPQMLTCYRLNCERLLTELARGVTSRSQLNTIRAYYHIVRSMEEAYELGQPPLSISLDGRY